eukprot:01948.XXX_25008_25233_1 [CDS] Oithona nana genome sequencing.
MKMGMVFHRVFISHLPKDLEEYCKKKRLKECCPTFGIFPQNFISQTLPQCNLSSGNLPIWNFTVDLLG